MTRGSVSIRLIHESFDIWFRELSNSDRHDERVGFFRTLNHEDRDAHLHVPVVTEKMDMVDLAWLLFVDASQRREPRRNTKVFSVRTTSVDEMLCCCLDAEEHAVDHHDERHHADQTRLQDLGAVLEITMTGTSRPFTITTVNPRRHLIRR